MSDDVDKVIETTHHLTGGVNSMIVYDPATQHGSNACAKNRGNCSHLCLPVSPTARVCQCSVGYTNDPNDVTKCIGKRRGICKMIFSNVALIGYFFQALKNSFCILFTGRLKG